MGVSPARAEWGTHYEAARVALEQEDFATAEREALAALRDAEAVGKRDGRRFESHQQLARVYRATRQWAAAATLLEQVVDGMKANGDADSQPVAQIYNNLGVTYQQMRDNAKAQRAYEAALAIQREDYKANLASIAIVVTNLGEIYRRGESWDKAERLHHQSIADAERAFGPDDLSLVPSLTNLALVYNETQRYDESIPLLSRAKRIAATSADRGHNAEMGTVLHELGDAYARKGEPLKAAGLYRQAVALRRDVLGDKHPNLSESLNNYGGVLLGLGRLDEALAAYDEAIAIRAREYGESSPRTRLVMSNKALCLDRMKRFEEAASLRQEIERLRARHAE
jgi:tetratricopeptide (TPR) repeat protein